MIRKIVISTGVVTTIAGSAGSTGSTNATGTAARFKYPRGIAIDGTNLYVSDTDNHMIRKIGLTGTVTADVKMHNLDDDTDAVVSIASSDTGVGTVSPATLTFTEANWNTDRTVTVTGVNDTDRDRHQAYKISLSAADQEMENPEVTTLAGSSSGFAEGTGTSAKFQNPLGVISDGTNLYVADRHNHRIRKIVISTGAVTTIAGSGSAGFADGTGTSAKFSSPAGLAIDGTNLYVADTGNYRVRKIVISTGAVTTLAGSGSRNFADGTGTSAHFNYPMGVTSVGDYIYVTDRYNQRIRKIHKSTGAVTTIAGTGNNGFLDHNTGTSAKFYYPWGIQNDGTNLYVGDGHNQRIRKIVIATGAVTTLAGSTSGTADGSGTAAQFSYPYEVGVDKNNVYVADYGNHRIRKIALWGTVTADLRLHNLDDDTDATVNLVSSDTTEGTVSPATLTFKESNWNTAQTVTVT